MSEGRFNMRYETASMYRGMKEFQNEVGYTVQWYKFNKPATTLDSIYDEGNVMSTSGGRRWYPPIPMPFISILRREGTESQTETGFYTTDTIHLVGTSDQLRKAGLTGLDTDTDDPLLDRFIFNGVVFSPVSIQVEAHIENRYHTIGLDAKEVDPAELIDDPDFAKYAL